MMSPQTSMLCSGCCTNRVTESWLRTVVFEGSNNCELELPDLILLDLMMPGINGIETCFQIKAREAWKHIPIVMMTAADELSRKLAAFDAGAVDFLD